jgi:hypothetical protein
MSTFPVTVGHFVEPLLSAGFAVWLVGSRANQTYRTDSDWDFLVFGNPELLAGLTRQPNPGNIDALVVYDGDCFRCPWPRASDGVIKSGSLSGWRWNETSPSTATYQGSKATDDWSMIRIENSIRVWRAEGL